MLFTARSRKQGEKRSELSGSKDSKKSNLSKMKTKIQSLSLSEIKLREAINIKFEKSKLKSFQFTKLPETQSKSKIKRKESSPDSDELVEYGHLVGQRFVNLKEYHKENHKEKRNHIRIRNSENRRTINTEGEDRNSLKFAFHSGKSMEKDDFQKSFFSKNLKTGIGYLQITERNACSEEKTIKSKKLDIEPFNRKPDFSCYKKTPSQQDEAKLRLHYLRKERKSPEKQFKQ